MTSEWISVEERLPSPMHDVLIASLGPGGAFGYMLQTGCHDGQQWNAGALESETVTHWMPLPEPPEVDDAPPKA